MSWRNTGLTFPPDSPSVCRIRHWSWCFIVHRQLLGEALTVFIRTMHLPLFLARSRWRLRLGRARPGPPRRVVARRHLLATCKASTSSPIRPDSSFVLHFLPRVFFKVDITRFRKRDVRHTEFWFTIPSLSPFIVRQKESFEEEWI
jgi:hypothetical protein